MADAQILARSFVFLLFDSFFIITDLQNLFSARDENCSSQMPFVISLMTDSTIRKRSKVRRAWVLG